MLSRMRSTTAMIGSAALSIVILAGCSSGSTESTEPSSAATSAAQTTTLTKEEAGKRYLALVCPNNALLEEFKKGLTTLTLNADKKALATKLAASEAGLSRELTDPAYTWPSNVAEPIADFAAATYAQSAQFTAAAKSGKVTAFRESTGEEVAAAGAKIRLQLGLPPQGSGC